MPYRKRPDLYVEQILKWADEYHRHTGQWPNVNSGRVPFSDDTWRNIDDALAKGNRGLPRGSGWTLARLLNVHRGVRNSQHPPALEDDQIVVWAEAHFARTGHWPTDRSGPLEEDPDENWRSIDMALRVGSRGLPGESSLARLLAARGVKRNRTGLPRLTVARILKWADAHRRRVGAWPRKNSGPVSDAPGETWLAVDAALRAGRRGLTGGLSLAKLLEQRRGVPNVRNLPRLSQAKILRWCDAHRRRTGRWPHRISGPIHEAPGEVWLSIDNALRLGLRGLPGGSSLARLLAAKRGKRNRKALPRLTKRQIRYWAKAHKKRTDGTPTSKSGPIPESPGETWSAVDQALRKGLRGLPGGSSLAKLFAAKHGAGIRRKRSRGAGTDRVPRGA